MRRERSLPECPGCGAEVYYAMDGTPMEDDPDHEATRFQPGRIRPHQCPGGRDIPEKGGRE